MQKGESRNYFRKLFDQQRQPMSNMMQCNPKVIDNLLSTPNPPKQKKEHESEKVHPLVRLAFEKKTRAKEQAERLIEQRKRCNSYVQIAREEERRKRRIKKKDKDSNKLLLKICKRMDEQIHKESNIQKKLTRRQNIENEQKSGPPYRPIVLKEKELFSTSRSKIRDNRRCKKRKSSKYPPLHAMKVMKKLQMERLKKLMQQREKARFWAEQERIQHEMQLAEKEKMEKEQAKRVISSQIDQTKPLQSQPLRIKYEQTSKIKIEPIKAKLEHEIKPEIIDLQQTKQKCSNKYYQIKQQEYESGKPTWFETKIEEEDIKIGKQLNSIQQQRIKLDEIQRRLGKRRWQLRKQKQSEVRQREYQYKMEQRRKKNYYQYIKDKWNYPDHSPSFNSTDSNSQSHQNWKQLRKTTVYDPFDHIYQERDRQANKESTFSETNREELINRRIGAQEEQADRNLQRKLKKWNY